MASLAYNPRRSGQVETLAYNYGVIEGRKGFPTWDAVPSRYYLLDQMKNVYSFSGHSHQGRLVAERDFITGWKDGFAEAKKGKRNPLFLPKSLFDSYIVKSDGGEITVDKIQTLAGAERKVKDVAKKFPCVGFSVLSAKYGGVIKHYAAAVGKGTPKVDEDNSREYKKTATREAKESVKFRLYINGQEYADYESKSEAEKVGRKEAGSGGKWRVKQVSENPRMHSSNPFNGLVMKRSEVGAAFGDSHQRGNVGSLLYHSFGTLAGAKAGQKRGGKGAEIAKVVTASGEMVGYLVYRPHVNNPTPDNRKYIRVTWSDGNTTETEINGTEEEIRRYYIGQHFNVGRGEHDHVVTGKKVEFLSHRGSSNPGAKLDYVVTYFYANGTRNREYFTQRAEAEKQLRKYYRNHKGGHGEITTTPHLTRPQREFGVRQNPDGDSGISDARSLYSDFHGEDSDGETEYVETLELPDNFVELGDLVSLRVITTHGKKPKDVTISAPDPDRHDAHEVVKLASAPDGKQLYFIGGNQALELNKLDFNNDEIKPAMFIGVLCEVTYRTRKGFDKFKLTDYYHHLGEETGNEPILTYDETNNLMHVVGGAYKVKDVGIVN